MTAQLPTRLFDALLRLRKWLLVSVTLAVLAGLFSSLELPVDMSFRPTFTGDARELSRTEEHERAFGQAGFRELVAIIDVHDAADPRALSAVARLSERLGHLPAVVEVRDPLHFPFADRNGALQPGGVLGSLPAGTSLDSASGRSLIADLLRSATARRIVIGDGDQRVAVAASIDIPNEAFSRRRDAVSAFRGAVSAWSAETGYATQVTGYPEVEQVYAREVLLSVFRSVGALLLMMIALLFVYFRRWSDVVTCLAGVTLSVPLVLGVMALLGQPFSIVNSQVLTLVLIVGIGQALHHQEEYRRRREAGRGHHAANREAFTILAWPSFMTGFATLAGFAALLSASMRAIWSFGLSTALGVAIVYAVNWLVVPQLIQFFYRNASQQSFTSQRGSWTLSVVRAADQLLQRRPRRVVVGFLLATALLAVFGISGLSVDQRVNEELPKAHSAVRAEATYEREFAGFLGPELAIRARAPNASINPSELTQFVNRLCDMPEVRYLASPLDFSPQPALASQNTGKACRRIEADPSSALAARLGNAGLALARLAKPVVSNDPRRAAVVVRVADMGTAHSLPFVERIREAARETMPHAEVQPVGQWWLAQQGMNRLSFDVMWSAISALLVILPIMWFAIADLKLFLAAIPPTILPVFATLGFMGLAHITVRIGTAMILAIALGLAADDTIHLSIRIRDRLRAGCDSSSAVSATLLRTGRPCSFSSYVLIGGFASMLASSLLALQAMGLIAMFSMTFALATDLVLGPALYLLLAPPRQAHSPCAESVAALLEDSVRLHPERPAISYRVGGTFRVLSWHEYAHLALELVAKLEHLPGAAQTVAILADTDARYPLLELALGLSGRTVQPLYVTASDDDLRRALASSGASVLVVGASRLERARRAALVTTVLDLEELVELPGVHGRPHAALPAHIEPFDSAAVRARLASIEPRSAATPLLYLQSTGTTEPARVIEISESALLHAVHAISPEASHLFPRFLSFLPTAHISERLLTLYVSLAIAGHTVYGGGLATLAADLTASVPTALLTPPLLLETLRAEALAAARTTRLGRWLLRRVQANADALLESGVAGGAPASLAARVFGIQLRRTAGLQHVRDFLAGAAPVPAGLHAWCEAIGVPLRIVYGQTELTGATSISPRRGASFGAAGLPVAGVELRISAQNELLVRSGARFSRYLGEAAATSITLEGDWLHSGDRARLGNSGEIVLLGRMQDVMPACDGTLVDTSELAKALRASCGPGEYVFWRTNGGAYLYVALPFCNADPARPVQAVSKADSRWATLARALEQLDAHRLVSGFALLDGAFQESTGELGPTGKPRSFRIHALHFEGLQVTQTNSNQETAHVTNDSRVVFGANGNLGGLCE